MTKQQATNKIQTSDNREAQFVLNVVQNWHGNKADMVIGLSNLVAAGHDVRTAQFDLNILLIDGGKASWCVLSEWKNRRV